MRSIDMTKHIQSTVDSHLHKKRRAPFNNFFSRMKIAQLEEMIRGYANTMSDTVTQTQREDGVVNLR